MFERKKKKIDPSKSISKSTQNTLLILYFLAKIEKIHLQQLLNPTPNFWQLVKNMSARVKLRARSSRVGYPPLESSSASRAWSLQVHRLTCLDPAASRRRSTLPPRHAQPHR
ncbi:hypothetical protein BDA96_04G097500 [Sorghum bicolor]|uniref:Uncharacterized protein n=2 Tax=Sorghum bicolor TaxID=4558 RepID=A0A921R4J8_SORBI|nr:hypothetical protein BDA96_04G097500 [Sorghum bicolor]KXG29782.1 hypothetical protein SORBI_3004G089500 [Sorghum bicolor]